jgi:hypothetical protein
MAGTKPIDPRRLVSLANAARKAGITKLQLPDGTIFELGTLPAKEEPAPRFPVPDRIPEATSPPRGSSEWLRNRFGDKS